VNQAERKFIWKNRNQRNRNKKKNKRDFYELLLLLALIKKHYHDIRKRPRINLLQNERNEFVQMTVNKLTSKNKFGRDLERLMKFINMKIKKKKEVCKWKFKDILNIYWFQSNLCMIDNDDNEEWNQKWMNRVNYRMNQMAKGLNSWVRSYSDVINVISDQYRLVNLVKFES
jgi:hypothetical protein